MMSEVEADIAFKALMRLDDKRAVTAVCLTWLENFCAGDPEVTLMQERVRQDAKSWASWASQAELEAYMVAAFNEIQDAPMVERAAKRIAALGFKRMSEESKLAFRQWIETQQQGEKE